MKDLFVDDDQWLGFAKANVPFSTLLEGQRAWLTPEGMADEMARAQVWLDFACVPQ